MIWAWVILAVALSACTGTPPRYPTTLTRLIELNIPFRPLLSAPETYRGKLVHLAGEMTRVKSENGTTWIEGQRRWIGEVPEYPGYRPLEYEPYPTDMFLLAYSDWVDAKGLYSGNKFVAVGELIAPSVNSNLSMIAFRAHCLHIWKTGPKPISYFVYRRDYTYEPLEEQTYCAKGSEAVLAQAADPIKAGAQPPAQPVPTLPTGSGP